MRWLLVFLAVAVGLGLGAAGLALLREEPPAELLPDLDQAVPSALSVVRAGKDHRLTFLSAVDNVGRGPLLVQGLRSSTATPTMVVSQIIRRTDGSERRLPVRAVMRYVEAERHAHWHILDFERYELRSTDGREELAPDRKTGFCLGDRYDADSERRLENEPDRAVWTQECGRGGSGLLAVSEGISPGYGDDYVPKLEGQYVVVTDLPAGRYLLVHRVNPERTLRESDYENNAASVLLELGRRERGARTVEVIARCHASDRCD
jgi:hypothetical protein